MNHLQKNNKLSFCRGLQVSEELKFECQVLTFFDLALTKFFRKHFYINRALH